MEAASSARLNRYIPARDRADTASVGLLSPVSSGNEGILFLVHWYCTRQKPWQSLLLYSVSGIQKQPGFCRAVEALWINYQRG